MKQVSQLNNAAYDTVISSQGSIHDGSLLHSRLNTQNTQLLITVHNPSTVLTQVRQILELQ
jgi:hypothetical protein